MNYGVSFGPRPWIISPSPFARRSECAGATGRPATYGYTDGVGFGIIAGETVIEAIGLGVGELINIALSKFAFPPRTERNRV